MVCASKKMRYGWMMQFDRRRLYRGKHSERTMASSSRVMIFMVSHFFDVYIDALPLLDRTKYPKRPSAIFFRVIFLRSLLFVSFFLASQYFSTTSMCYMPFAVLLCACLFFRLRFKVIYILLFSFVNIIFYFNRIDLTYSAFSLSLFFFVVCVCAAHIFVFAISSLPSCCYRHQQPCTHQHLVARFLLLGERNFIGEMLTLRFM